MTNALIAKLEAWKDHDFHADRQLADEILIATGWKCEPDASFEGGVRWFFGTNPQYSSSETTRPHPINDMNAAIGCVPFGFAWSVGADKTARADVNKWGQVSERGTAPIPTIALIIAALKAQEAYRRFQLGWKHAEEENGHLAGQWPEPSIPADYIDDPDFEAGYCAWHDQPNEPATPNLQSEKTDGI